MTDHDNERSSGERRYWLDDPRNVNKIVWALVVVCFGLFFADGFYAKPADIAEELFHVAHQPRSARSFLVEIRPFAEKW